jgi:DNA polymerase III delta subunit
MITVMLGDDRARLMSMLPAVYTTLDAENLTPQEVLEPLLTVSMFGDAGAFLVKDADKNSGFLAELEKSASKIAENAAVFIQFEKLAKNTRLYKLLAKTPGVKVVEYKIYVDNSLNFNILPAALAGDRREALALLKKSQLAGNEPIAVLGAMNFKLAQALEYAHKSSGGRGGEGGQNLAALQEIGRKFLNAREVLLSGVMDSWLYLATLLTEATIISSRQAS